MLDILASLPLLIKAGVIAAALTAGAFSHYILRLPRNNPIEQVAEAVIKEETGVDMDFSSLDSPEDDIEVKSE